MCPSLPHPDDVKELPISIGQLEFGQEDKPRWWERLMAWARRKPIDLENYVR